MKAPRVKIAGVVERLPRGSLRAAPASSTTAPRPTGRPPKPPGAKAQGLTVTLWPHELAALDRLQEAVNAELPAPVSRSDLARLAFSLLLDRTPEQIRKALVAARRKQPRP